MGWRRWMMVGAMTAQVVRGDVMLAWESAERDGGQGLEEILRECRIGRLTDHAKCQEAEYVSMVYHSYQRLRTASTSPGRAVSELPQISRGNSTAFQDFFVDYAVKGRPVVLQAAPETRTPLADVGPSLMDQCLNGTRGPSMISLPTICPEVASHMMVPRFISNDYTQRLRRTYSSKPTGEGGLQSYIDRYPQLAVGQPGQVQPLHGCPSEAHMMVTVEAGRLLVKVFNATQGGQLEPKLGTPPLLHEFIFTADVWRSRPVREEKVTNESPGTASGEQEEAETEEDATVEVKGSATTPSSPSPLASHSTTSLQPGDVLFLPRGSLMSWRYDHPDMMTKVVVACYVDASNLNAVKTALALASHVDPPAHKAWEAFMGPDLDTTMEREPVDLPWSTFTTWPRMARKEEGKGEEVGGAEGGNVTASSGGGRRRSGGRSARRGGFTNWQQKKKWDQTIMELTLPTPSIPKVVQIGRTNVTVEWTTAFTKRKEEVASVGYEISWTAQGQSGPAKEGQVVLLDEEVERTTAVNDPRVAEGVAVWLCQTIIRGLDPDTVYKFRSQLFFGEARGLWSAYSPPIHTQPLSAPAVPAHVAIDTNRTGSTTVMMKLDPPVDDGGVPIESYVVWKQHVDHGFREDWMLAGNFSSREGPTLSIRNLLPDTQYAFRVAAVNRLGMGPKTVATPRISTLASVAGESLHVGGHGHGSQNLQSEHGEIGPVLTLDTTLQQLTFPDSKSKPLEVWRSHWGPQQLHVTAEAVWADPLDAGTAKLANADMVRHRIAITNRGGVPLVQKASAVQSAGGLAVIVVDDGRCETGFDQFCCPGSDKNHGEGLAASDWPEPWRKIRIPLVLVLSHHGAILDQATEPYKDRITALLTRNEAGRDEL